MTLETASEPEIYLEAGRAISALKARVKALAREHSDRIKRLETLRKQIESREPGLVGVDRITLSPEVAQLVVHPTAGL